MATILPVVIIAAVVVNLLTTAAFAADKRAAIAGDRRTRESTLLWLAALGGTPAALRARRRYRHKTRKQPFTFHLHLIAAVQAGAVLGLASLW
ncbi:MAG: DUF1294 domain-containing protein [Sphingomonas taxi]|uniref:DUF1294 domain-containing protein n=1 Tax=Sphingomonas taxi TaxID=1549858 RepID=A0A2W5P9I6_9SPHN|nr:MAG: DUF1294 domain-containing protein [Sphingomonas taxi]